MCLWSDNYSCCNAAPRSFQISNSVPEKCPPPSYWDECICAQEEQRKDYKTEFLDTLLCSLPYTKWQRDTKQGKISKPAFYFYQLTPPHPKTKQWHLVDHSTTAHILRAVFDLMKWRSNCVSVQHIQVCGLTQNLKGIILMKKPNQIQLLYMTRVKHCMSRAVILAISRVLVLQCLHL